MLRKACGRTLLNQARIGSSQNGGRWWGVSVTHPQRKVELLALIFLLLRSWCSTEVAATGTATRSSMQEQSGAVRMWRLCLSSPPRLSMSMFPRLSRNGAHNDPPLLRSQARSKGRELWTKPRASMGESHSHLRLPVTAGQPSHSSAAHSSPSEVSEASHPYRLLNHMASLFQRHPAVQLIVKGRFQVFQPPDPALLVDLAIGVGPQLFSWSDGSL